ncbi:MAG TPA: hypothetical protein VFZ45_07205 [Actinomycetota bacterium]|nr:hypothetical protein [Actinomycetota bacterium]
MPKRWKITAEVVLTDGGTEADRDDFDWDTDNEKKARDKFDKVKRKLDDEPPIED